MVSPYTNCKQHNFYFLFHAIFQPSNTFFCLHESTYETKNRYLILNARVNVDKCIAQRGSMTIFKLFKYPATMHDQESGGCTAQKNERKEKRMFHILYIIRQNYVLNKTTLHFFHRLLTTCFLCGYILVLFSDMHTCTQLSQETKFSTFRL